MSYGDFVGATFGASNAIKLNGANLNHADMSGAMFTADGNYGDVTIDFTGANLANADLSDSELTAFNFYYGYGTIDFTGVNLANADL
eukprot:scaffold85972_cov33-Phaeocystis_antarctica.AAC.1